MCKAIGLVVFFVVSCTSVVASPPQAPTVPLEEAIAALGSPYQDERNQGMKSIEEITPLPANRLLRALESDNLYIRRGSSELLARLAGPEQIDEATRLALAARITPKQDTTVSVNIVRLLHRIQARKAVPAALQYFRTRRMGVEDTPLQLALVRFSALGDQSAIPILHLQTAQSHDRALRRAAMVSLVQLGSKTHETDLVTWVHAEPDVVEKIQLIEALAETKTMAAFGVAAIYVHDASQELRMASYNALAALGTYDAARLLVGRIGTAENNADREAALARLLTFKSNTNLAVLLKAQWLRATPGPAVPRLMQAAATLGPRQGGALLIQMMERHANEPTEQMPTWGYTAQRLLRQISNQKFGKDLYSIPAAERQAILQAWKDWWQKSYGPSPLPDPARK